MGDVIPTGFDVVRCGCSKEMFSLTGKLPAAREHRPPGAGARAGVQAYPAPLGLKSVLCAYSQAVGLGWFIAVPLGLRIQ